MFATPGSSHHIQDVQVFSTAADGTRTLGADVHLRVGSDPSAVVLQAWTTDHPEQAGWFISALKVGEVTVLSGEVDERSDVRLPAGELTDALWNAVEHLHRDYRR